VVLAFLAVMAYSREQTAPFGPGMNALAVLLAIVLLALGVGLGAVALCGIPKHGTCGILVKSVAGLALNLVFICFQAYGFVQGFQRGVQQAAQNQRAAQEVTRASEEMRREARNSFDPSRGATNLQNESLRKFQRQFASATANLEGDDAKIAGVMDTWLRREQTLVKEMESASAESRRVRIFDFSGLAGRDELQSRRELAQRLAEANNKLVAFITNTESWYRSAMQARGVSPRVAESATADFLRGFNSTSKLSMRIRAADLRVCESISGVIDLMDRNWGKWRFDSAAGKLVFDDTAVAKDYNRLFREIKSASHDELEAQRLLLNQTARPAPPR